MPAHKAHALRIAARSLGASGLAASMLGRGQVSLRPLRAMSLFSMDLQVWGRNLVGFQSHRFWGLVSQMQVLKAEGASCGFKPFTPQGEALVLSSFSTVVHCTGEGVYGGLCPSFSYLLPCGPSLLLQWPLSRSCSASS